MAEHGDDDSIDPRDFRGLDPMAPDAPRRDGLPPSGGGGTNYSPFDIRTDMGEEVPYPKPQPLKLPDAIPRQRVDDLVLVAQAALRSVLKHPYSRDLVQAFLQETSRQQFTPVHLPPWIEMPIRGRNVGDTQSATVGAGATVNIVTLQMPAGSRGFVAWLGQDTQNDAAGVGRLDWANLQWTVAVGPNTGQLFPVPGLTAFVFQKGQIEAPCRINVFVPEGWVCVLQAKNTSGVGIPSVAGRIEGWSWPVVVHQSSLHENENLVG